VGICAEFFSFAWPIKAQIQKLTLSHLVRRSGRSEALAGFSSVGTFLRGSKLMVTCEMRAFQFLNEASSETSPSSFVWAAAAFPLLWTKYSICNRSNIHMPLTTYWRTEPHSEAYLAHTGQ
jgi:hypothetical protein